MFCICISSCVFVFPFVYLYFNLCISSSILLCCPHQTLQTWPTVPKLFRVFRNFQPKSQHFTHNIFTMFAIFSLKPNTLHITLLVFTIFSQNRNTLKYANQRWANSVLMTEYEYEYYSTFQKWPNTNAIFLSK